MEPAAAASGDGPWVVHVHIEKAEDLLLSQKPPRAPPSYLKLHVVSQKTISAVQHKAVNTTLTHKAPKKTVRNARSIAGVGAGYTTVLDPAWCGTQPEYNADFQFSLETLRDSRVPQALKLEFWQAAGFWDACLGYCELPLPSTDPSAVWVDDTEESVLRHSGVFDITMKGGVSAGRVHVKLTVSRLTDAVADALFPEFYVGTKVVPNLRVFGSSAFTEEAQAAEPANPAIQMRTTPLDEEQAENDNVSVDGGSSRSEDNTEDLAEREAELAEEDKYRVNEWRWVRANPAVGLRTLEGVVVSINETEMNVGVQWKGDPEARTYFYCAKPELLDVLPVSHEDVAEKTSGGGNLGCEWSLLDYYQVHQLRHSLVVMEKMYTLVRKKLARSVQRIAVGSDVAEAKRTELRDLVFRGELSKEGWLTLYAVLQAFMDNWDSLAKDHAYNYNYSWDDQVGPVQRAMLRAIFDQTFPAKHRFALFQAAGLAGRLQSEESPLAAPELRAIVDGWERGNCDAEQLAEVEAVVIAWTGTLRASKSVKAAMDAIMRSVAMYVDPEGLARSVVLSRTFMYFVGQDAERNYRAALSDFALPPKVLAMPDAAAVADEVRKFLAPYGNGGGPWQLITLMESANNVYMLLSTEALEEYINPAASANVRTFIKDLKAITNREVKAPALASGKSVVLFQGLKMFEKIEGKFGVAISEFFKLILYLIVVNFICFLMTFFIVVFPWALWAHRDPYVQVDQREAWKNFFGFGTGYAEYTLEQVNTTDGAPEVNFPSRAMAEGNYWFYGAYPPALNERAYLPGAPGLVAGDYADFSSYRLGAAFTGVVVVSLVLAFVLVAWEMSARKARDVGTNLALDEYVAKWTRAIEKRKDDGLVNQQRPDDKALEPASKEQAEKLGKVRMANSNHMQALYSYNIGLNDTKGRRTKVEMAAKYWQLQYDLYGFTQGLSEDETILRLKSVLHYLGSFACLVVFGLGIFLLTYIEDRTPELEDKAKFLPGLLVNFVLTAMPVATRIIVEFLEVHYDEAHRTYKSICVAFACKMFALVYVTLRYMNAASADDTVCGANELGGIFYNLSVTGFTIDAVGFFVYSSFFYALNYNQMYPEGVKTIRYESTLLTVPLQYFPSREADLKVRRHEHTIDVEFRNDAFFVARELYYVVADVVRGGLSLQVREEGDAVFDAEKNRVLCAQAAMNPACNAQQIANLAPLRDTAERARAACNKIVTGYFEREDSQGTEQIIRMSTQRLDVLAKVRALDEQVAAAMGTYKQQVPKLVQEVLDADAATDFETVLAPMSWFKDDREFRILYNRFEKFTAQRVGFSSWRHAKVPLMQHMSMDAHWVPSATGVSGYHHLPDQQPQWLTADHMPVLDSHGELLPAVRMNMANEGDEKKLKFLEEQVDTLCTQIEETDAHFEEMRMYGTSEQQQQILVKLAGDVHELCRLLRFFAYLAQKIKYTTRVNLFSKHLNVTKADLPAENGHDEVHLPTEVLSLIYLQALIWITSLFSPMALGHGFVLLCLFFIIRYTTYTRCLATPKKPLAIGANSYFFYAMLMVTLVCVLVPGASFFYTKQDCGPHAGTTPAEGMWDWIGDWPYILRRIVNWIFEPYVLLTLVVVFITMTIVLGTLYYRTQQELQQKNKELALEKVLAGEKVDAMVKFADSLRTQQRSRVLASTSNRNFSEDSMFASESLRLRMTNSLASTIATMMAEAEAEADAKALAALERLHLKNQPKVKEAARTLRMRSLGSPKVLGRGSPRSTVRGSGTNRSKSLVSE